MRCTLVLVLTLLVLTQTKPHKPTLNLTSFEEFYDTPATTLANFTLVSDCILRNDNVGLNVAPEMCWNGRQMYVRCPSRMKKGVYDLDDYEGFRTVLTPEKEYLQRIKDASSITWYNGTAFLMTSHLWPHNIQHIWPVLNVPALGLNLRHIGLFGFVHWGKRGGFHPYSVGLLKAIASTYNLTTFPPVLAQNQGPSWWRKASVNLRTLHCFERVVVPNKGPSPKFQIHTGAFMSRHVVTGIKQQFLERYYPIARQEVGDSSSFLKAYPRRPLWKVLIINRKQWYGRRLLNEAAMVQMIKSLGAPVEVATFERSSFARQFLALSQAGVVVAPHGANLVNALLLPPGAVAVEVYPLPIRYRYGEWAEYLQRSGTKCVEFCVNDKNPDLPCNLSKRGKPYPYTNVAVDLDRLRPVVQAALDMVLRTMAEP
jgi:hypothetical protein